MEIDFGANRLSINTPYITCCSWRPTTQDSIVIESDTVVVILSIQEFPQHYIITWLLQDGNIVRDQWKSKTMHKDEWVEDFLVKL